MISVDTSVVPTYSLMATMGVCEAYPVFKIVITIDDTTTILTFSGHYYCCESANFDLESTDNDVTDYGSLIEHIDAVREKTIAQ